MRWWKIRRLLNSDGKNESKASGEGSPVFHDPRHGTLRRRTQRDGHGFRKLSNTRAWQALMAQPISSVKQPDGSNNLLFLEDFFRWLCGFDLDQHLSFGHLLALFNADGFDDAIQRRHDPVEHFHGFEDH
jgi:hypothetical protein